MVKRPKIAAEYPRGKQPRLSPSPPGPDPHVSWRFNEADRDGPFSWAAIADADLQRVVLVMESMDDRTWNAASGDGVGQIKAIPVANLGVLGLKRLRDLHLDDLEVLHEIRLAARPRVWGIRRLHTFHVLWWDPDHQVCPSKLKHT